VGSVHSTIAERDAVIADRDQALSQKERERLRKLRERRDTLARRYVRRRLTALGKALRRKPLNVVEANKALKEAVSKIVLDPEAGDLTIHWHHSEVSTEGGPFYSRHCRIFDDVSETT
jgi:hypothetical protein